MPNNAMPHENMQSPAIPKQNQSQSNSQPTVKRQPNDHPNPMDKGSGTKEAFENEGEGSRSAARNYDAATEKYVKSGRVPEAARKAKAAIVGAEAEALAAAEEEGLRGDPREEGMPGEEGEYDDDEE
jgi:hypothetical protein